MNDIDAVSLRVIGNLLESVAEEMGTALERTGMSPNIKERLDHSCAIFDANAELVAQAAHIPVHLGSMAYAMADIVGACDWSEGDMLVLNDPFLALPQFLPVDAKGWVGGKRENKPMISRCQVQSRQAAIAGGQNAQKRYLGHLYVRNDGF